MKNRALLSTHSLPVGRFAPSPTGDLHLGSLVAAVASYLNVKKHNGKWLLRFDDIDTPRVVKGSQDAILSCLDAHHFEWDSIIVQSQRLSIYEDALSTLLRNKQCYPCTCTRAQILRRTHQISTYDNHCRSQHIPLDSLQQHSIRMFSSTKNIDWQDMIQGHHSADINILGDFIVKRSDGFIAYHLACAIDDSDFGVTEVIRGADLLPATPYQQWIQTALKRHIPTYGHHPLIENKHGIKISKASAAPPLNAEHATQNIVAVLKLLGQTPPEALVHATLDDVWDWAIQHWTMKAIPNGMAFNNQDAFNHETWGARQ